MPLITGVLHKPDGTVAAGVRGKVVRFVPADGSAVITADLSFYTDADGAIKSKDAEGVEQDGFTLLPGTAWISAPVEGFSDALTGKGLTHGRAVTVADEDEIDFNDLVPAVSVTVSAVTSGQLADIQADVDALNAEIDALTAGAPSALDTLNELAAAINDDANFAAAVTTALAGKQATSEKNQANGYVGLDGSGLIPDNRLPASVARDSEVEAGDAATLTSANAYADAAVAGIDLSGKQDADSDLSAISALAPSNDDLLQRKGGAWANRTPAQVKTDLALVKADVGLGNVTNDAQLKIASDLSDLANAATARTNLGLGTAATEAAATLLARANHTGEQAIASVTGLQDALDDKADAGHTHTLSTGATDVTATAAELNTLAGVRRYVALLTQSGTDAPVATELVNTLGGTPVWAYSSAGVYTATLTNAFTADKTTAEITSRIPGGNVLHAAAAARTSASVVTVRTSDIRAEGGIHETGDDLLAGNTLRIEVYP